MKEFPFSDRIMDVVRNTAFDALCTATEGLLTEIIDVCPVRTGTLRRSHTVTRYPNRMAVSISANTPYALMVHEGYGPFEIRPREKKALYWKGARHPVKKVRHPGYKGNPWMRRAVEQNLDKVGRYILLQVEKALSKELR